MQKIYIKKFIDKIKEKDNSIDVYNGFEIEEKAKNIFGSPVDMVDDDLEEYIRELSDQENTGYNGYVRRIMFFRDKEEAPYLKYLYDFAEAMGTTYQSGDKRVLGQADNRIFAVDIIEGHLVVTWREDVSEWPRLSEKEYKEIEVDNPYE